LDSSRPLFLTSARKAVSSLLRRFSGRFLRLTLNLSLSKSLLTSLPIWPALILSAIFFLPVAWSKPSVVVTFWLYASCCLYTSFWSYSGHDLLVRM